MSKLVPIEVTEENRPKDIKQLQFRLASPEKRTMLKVTLEDAMEADEIFSILMGERVEPRREFIEAHARDVKNLDV